MKTKFIFVTGGVVSGLGKGIAAASIGNLLSARKFSIFVLKLDPYLNIDPGVMSPYEHGEVFVTKDGGETDLDLGHYERFIDVELTKDSNWTSGRIYRRLFDKERDGGFLGKTVQVIPHLTDEINKIILETAQKHQPDFMIIEVGGTVGDIESNPFFYALGEFKKNYPENVFLIHVTYVLYLNASQEFKTKPTQNSLTTLSSFGLRPDLLILRNNRLIPQEILIKVAKSSLLEIDNVISVPDLKNIYFAPIYFEGKKTADLITNYFNIKTVKGDFESWNNLVKLIESKKENQINLLMVGKYVEFLDAYKSIIEAFKVASYHQKMDLNMTWLAAEKLIDEPQNFESFFKDQDGVVILPGFGNRGFEGKVKAAAYTREAKIPTFGICLGMQAMSVVQARLKGLSKATSAEFSGTFEGEETYVLNILEGRSKNKSLGGTLRLGNYDVILKKDSLAYKAYGKEQITERHRHRYEINPLYRHILEDENFVFSGNWTIDGLAEIAELKNHPFYLGTQYHPEFTSRPLKGHPLFNLFLKEVLLNKQKGIK